jgi:hypothetical protein
MSPEGPESWMEYRQYVVRSLTSLQEGQAEVVDELTALRIEVAMLKVRSGIWGGLAGLVPGAVGVLTILLMGGGPGG